ncbi:endoplasmic reticulum-derived transport vesicle ERV46 [Ceratobasidium sp. AG-I]|nr:endoplasmic reticulum-derived transport vesicle ERV46 [Ceratobasidium sp. AG-I]
MAFGMVNRGFKALDGFGKTMEDVKVKTRTGALLTMVSAAIIILFSIIELVNYRRVVVDSSIVVNQSTGESFAVKMNITFPRVPCFLLSLDINDISGDILQDVHHNVLKTRLDSNRQIIHENTLNHQIDSQIEKTLKDRPKDYCGPCYGADPPDVGCCQTCESVRQAYLTRGWSFEDPDAIEQCRAEHWTTNIHEQSSEGCRISGRIRVRKVTGNLHFSPGRSFVTNRGQVHDLVPYLKDGNHHDYGHEIHEFHFESEYESEDEWRGTDRHTAWRKKVGLEKRPLDGVSAHAKYYRNKAPDFMFQYFLKVVSTEYRYLDGDLVRGNQYSVTDTERDLSRMPEDDERNAQGTHITHGIQGLPGAFFHFEISPMLVTHRETRPTFAHFMTSLCAIVGGVLTLASIVDSVAFAAGSPEESNE